MNDSYMREVFVVFQTAQRRVSPVTHALLPNSQEGPPRTFNPAAASRLLSCLASGGSAAWRRGQCWCRDGTWECPVTHNSAKLEATCSFCGKACFSHLWLWRKSDSSMWLSFSFCLFLQQPCRPSSVLSIYLDSWFGKECKTICREQRWRFATGIPVAPFDMSWRSQLVIDWFLLKSLWNTDFVFPWFPCLLAGHSSKSLQLGTHVVCLCIKKELKPIMFLSSVSWSLYFEGQSGYFVVC